MSKLLERLDKLEKAAVPGPWEADKSGIVFDDDGISICTCKDRGDGNPTARLIAELRNAYPKLRAVVEVAHRLAVDFDRADLGKARFFDPEEEVLVGELNVALAALEEDV